MMWPTLRVLAWCVALVGLCVAGAELYEKRERVTCAATGGTWKDSVRTMGRTVTGPQGEPITSIVPLPGCEAKTLNPDTLVTP